MKEFNTEFKTEIIERLLERHGRKLSLTTCQQIRRVVQRGAGDLDPYALYDLCRDLECLPSDILRAV